MVPEGHVFHGSQGFGICVGSVLPVAPQVPSGHGLPQAGRSGKRQPRTRGGVETEPRPAEDGFAVRSVGDWEPGGPLLALTGASPSKGNSDNLAFNPRSSHRSRADRNPGISINDR